MLRSFGFDSRVLGVLGLAAGLAFADFAAFAGLVLAATATAATAAAAALAAALAFAFVALAHFAGLAVTRRFGLGLLLVLFLVDLLDVIVLVLGEVEEPLDLGCMATLSRPARITAPDFPDVRTILARLRLEP